jgi:RNA polymerase sigma-70 factor (ECF subfamily)
LAKDISFVYGLCNDYDLAQDLAQENIYYCLANWKHLEMNPALGLVFRIASNNCLRQIEKKIGFQKELTDEKTKKSLEPQIQFLYKCIAEPETDRIIISLNSKR